MDTTEETKCEVCGNTPCTCVKEETTEVAEETNSEATAE